MLLKLTDMLIFRIFLLASELKFLLLAKNLCENLAEFSSFFSYLNNMGTIDCVSQSRTWIFPF